nr:hypothetical protein [Tanacetum cinerariifolium]
MSFGSQSVGDAVVPKFDMHIYTLVLTADEVKSLVEEYVVPLDQHPCVPPSGLTMNRLSAGKIGVYDQYLEMSGVKEISDAMPWRHHDSSVADPSPIRVRAEDNRRLCANIIDLHPV